MKSTGALFVGRWCPEHWAPQHRRIAAALLCSLLLHAFLMVAGNGAGDLNRNTRFVAQLLSTGSHTAPFLVVSLPQDRQLSDSVPEEKPSLSAHEPLLNEKADVFKPDKPTKERSDSLDVSRSKDSTSRAVPNQAMPDGPPEGSMARRATEEDAANRLRREAYMRTALLDVPPQLLQDIQPVYPVTAGNQEGAVVLRLFISERGEVDELLVARASPRGFFEEAALAAFAPARFSPGIHNGNAVKSQVAVEVQFVPYNRGADVSGRGY